MSPKKSKKLSSTLLDAAKSIMTAASGTKESTKLDKKMEELLDAEVFQSFLDSYGVSGKTFYWVNNNIDSLLENVDDVIDFGMACGGKSVFRIAVDYNEMGLLFLVGEEAYIIKKMDKAIKDAKG